MIRLPAGRAPSLVAAVALLAAGLAAGPAGGAGRATAGPATITDPARYVNTFVGTKPGAANLGYGGTGNTFPGADAPFGMLQWSPDTVTRQHGGGYAYGDNRIRGFSLTHLSGAGCDDFDNIPFMPSLGTAAASSATFSHAHESAAPGRYAVTFDNGLRTELAAGRRAGIARFGYPGTDTASLLVDVAQAANRASGSYTLDRTSISGYQDGGGFCGRFNHYRLYFTVTFDHAISGVSTPKPNQPVLHFDTSSGRTVTARVGISFVSVANARANVAAEQGNRSLSQVAAATRSDWNALLGRIAVGGGSTDRRRVLYTALYHSLQFPETFSDANGQYAGFDGRTHQAAPGHAQYATFSGWDVYRSQIQLVALLDPGLAADIAQSIDNQGAQAGWFDRWTVANGPTGEMNGDPLPSMAASVYAFGGTGFDAAGLLRRAVAGAHDDRERPLHAAYDVAGYLPDPLPRSAATSLEYYADDFALSQLATRLGDTATATAELNRSRNWRKLFHGNPGYLQPRQVTGGWPAFDPTSQNGYLEGNGAQYTWAVPFDYRGLYTAMGGNAAVTSRLDSFFGKLNAGPDKPNAYLADEPSLGVPWAYAYAGAPYRTQAVVRQALDTLFTPGPDGEAGNDDLGELSSWAVFASLGMYPEVPGRAEMVLASPLFPRITLTRSTGARIDISAPGAAAGHPYVHALTVDGRASTRPWLPESVVTGGGSLSYTLGSTPDRSWGSAAGDAPPSFGG